ncbi:Rac prophage; ParB-like nuclease domain-containing protein YnaK (modular protein) [Burkholderia diffusa]|uniref:ParB/Srx family N-terminal domain-containing protein n=1 Tax=Burkholderia diffusa TaxID=488732 RepID=UPI001CAC8F7F|nr:ParB/Srx family N-terminal domain-containing protein [Burkholderia diffusa]CAG9243777.1 Rac prophage; ParB-like nuclease domain-containing protein YnaK (modular protein) [Burkholderia diffusa]
MNRLPSWSAERIERWPLDRIHEAANNPRTHSEQQVEAIAASMREFGWTIPVLVDESGELIAGHGRVAAARVLGLADAPVIVAQGWSDAQKRAYRIADNKLTINAGWDSALLSAELSALSGEGFDADLLGFSADDMARLTDDTDRLALDFQAQTAIHHDPTAGPAATGPAPPIVAADPPPLGGPAATADANPVYVPFSCMLALADRPVVFDAIAQAKARGAPDSGAALVAIARAWLETLETA